MGFDVARELHEFSHVVANLAVRIFREFNALLNEKGVQAEIDLDVSGFLLGGIVELFSLSDELHGTRKKIPVGGIVGCPKIPVSIEDVGVVVVDEVGSDQHCLLGRDAGRITALENTGLVPGDWLHDGIGNARALSGKRELLEHGVKVREHRRSGEVGKPETEIERIDHSKCASSAA